MISWLKVSSPVGKDLRKTIPISGKHMEVTCTARAMDVLAKRQQPLVVEMEQTFGCFARKTVHFHESTQEQNLILVTDKLAVYARFVIPDSCDGSAGGKPATIPSLTPRWLRLDYVGGKWTGEYGL